MAGVMMGEHLSTLVEEPAIVDEPSIAGSPPLLPSCRRTSRAQLFQAYLCCGQREGLGLVDDTRHDRSVARPPPVSSMRAPCALLRKF
jgi:hypothetical protein